jgi:hypothetical protein
VARRADLDRRQGPEELRHPEERGRSALRALDRCSSLRAALAYLGKWEKDPEAFAVGNVRRSVIFLDDALINRFCECPSCRRTRWHGSRSNGPSWGWWRDHLGKRDLRRLTLIDHIDRC